VVYEEYLPVTGIALSLSLADVQNVAGLTRVTILSSQVVNRVGWTVKADVLVGPHEWLAQGTGGQIMLLVHTVQQSNVSSLICGAVVPVPSHQVVLVDQHDGMGFMGSWLVERVAEFTLHGRTNKTDVLLTGLIHLLG